MIGVKESDRHAFGVLLSLVLCIVVIAALGLAARYEAAHLGTVKCDNIQLQQNIRRTDEYCLVDDHIYFGDGVAQWIMAIFSVAATVLSGIAILLLRDTLVANTTAARAAIDAAEAANRTNLIANADRRPWVTIRREIACDFSASEIPPGSPGSEVFKYRLELHWWYSLDNLGKSPAFGVYVSQKLVVAGGFIEARNMLREFVGEIDAKSRTNTERTIFPNEKTGTSGASIRSKILHDDAQGDKFFLLVAVAYRTQESDILGIEGRVCLITSERDAHGPKICQLIEYSEARITR